MRNELLKTYKDLYIGNEFVYVSKYGDRTFGICKDISITSEVVPRPELEKSLNKIINKTDSINENNYQKSQNIKNVLNESKNPTYKKYNIVIHSTNNIEYNINEVYFKSKSNE